MERHCITAIVLALTCSPGSFAAEQNAPIESGQTSLGEAEMNTIIRTESQQPMDMNEPMPIGMARKGMKKGDVKSHAMKKEAVMDEKMMQEEMKH
jgi:hypothetical protein